MPKSRKRKGAKKIQYVPNQVTVRVGEHKETGDPIYAKVKTNTYREVRHNPVPGVLSREVRVIPEKESIAPKEE